MKWPIMSGAKSRPETSGHRTALVSFTPRALFHLTSHISTWRPFLHSPCILVFGFRQIFSLNHSPKETYLRQSSFRGTRKNTTQTPANPSHSAIPLSQTPTNIRLHGRHAGLHRVPATASTSADAGGSAPSPTSHGRQATSAVRPHQPTTRAQQQ